MTNQLDGTVALVTGASSGIGTATAQALAALGATVALAARRTERITELADKIRAGSRFAQTQKMEAADIAATIVFVITRPRHMSINEVLVRPTEQDN
jgi:NADP-dependent 3-hydroxy acid dehydrogenase YdfG